MEPEKGKTPKTGSEAIEELAKEFYRQIEESRADAQRDKDRPKD